MVKKHPEIFLHDGLIAVWSIVLPLAMIWLLAISTVSGLVIFQSIRNTVFSALIWLALCASTYFPVKWSWKAVKKISAADRLFYGLASLTLGLICATFVPFPEKTVQLLPHEISVTSLNSTACLPAVLTGMSNDGVFASYNSFTIRGWSRVDSALVSAPGENSLSWKGFARNSVLMFRGNPDSCAVRISVDVETTTYDLSNQGSNEILIHNELAQPAWVRWLTPFSLWICAASVFLFLILLFRQAMAACGVELQPHPRAATRKNTFLHYAILTLLVLFGFLFASASFHLLFEGDSSSYLSAGHSLAVGKGYLSDNGDHFDWWPPLYPLLLAGGYIQTLINIDTYLYALHAFLFVLTGVGSQVLLNLLFPQTNRLLLTAVNLTAAFSVPVLGSYLYLLSEAGFLPAVIWGFVFLYRFLYSRSFNDLLGYALCVLAATLFRYIGILIVITGAFCLFFFLKTDLRRKFLAAFTFSLFVSIPEIFWLGRNMILTGTATGLRTPSTLTPLEVLFQSNRTLAAWFVPTNELLITVLISAAMLISLAALVRRASTNRSLQPLSADEMFHAALLFFTCTYLLFIWRTMMLVANSNLGDRFLAPILYPLIILILSAGLQIIPDQAQMPAVWRHIFPVALVLLMAVPAFTHIEKMRTVDTGSYQTAYTRIINQNRLIGYLLRNPLEEGVPVVTNCPDCLSFAVHTYNALYINDEDFARAFFKDVDRPYYLLLFPQAWLPFGTTGNDWDLQRDNSQNAATLERLSGRPFTSRTLERNADGALFYLTPR